VRHLLGRAVLPRGSLRIEITESLVMENPERATHVLELLKSAGAELALDDFGTGYSSLAYLQRFPFDTIKIDRALVQSATESEAGGAIVRAIVLLAHELGKKVVAEGIETPEDAAFMRSLGCEYAQGYYYGQPMNERDAAQLIRLVTKSEKKMGRRTLKLGASRQSGNGKEKEPAATATPPAAQITPPPPRTNGAAVPPSEPRPNGTRPPMPLPTAAQPPAQTGGPLPPPIAPKTNGAAPPSRPPPPPAAAPTTVPLGRPGAGRMPPPPPGVGPAEIAAQDRSPPPGKGIDPREVTRPLGDGIPFGKGRPANGVPPPPMPGSNGMALPIPPSPAAPPPPMPAPQAAPPLPHVGNGAFNGGPPPPPPMPHERPLPPPINADRMPPHPSQNSVPPRQPHARPLPHEIRETTLPASLTASLERLAGRKPRQAEPPLEPVPPPSDRKR
jgi:hypothetical protein